MKSVEDLVAKLDTDVLMTRPLHEWFPILASECQVYSCDTMYLVKRFDEINYSFCDVNEAKQTLVDNLYTILRYKYFTKLSDEVNERITKIISSFTTNLRSVLKHVTFDEDVSASTGANLVRYLPDGCVAFANGVYDFVANKWKFKYDEIQIRTLSTKIYAYDPKYIIQWYLNFNFEPLPIDVKSTSIDEAIEVFKTLDKDQKNYCFELIYNIAHDSVHKFSIDRFRHICEILGYACLNSFCQNFVMLIGSGQNGKNSLFDGCFTNRLVPKPSSVDFDTIENDRFVSGSLENKAHNIFLETSAKKYVESKMIKALTGSMYQSIERKGVARYSGIINCKYIFAGNDRDMIKFNDTTVGFTRRINLFEIYYRWDAKKRFKKMGDYYDTTFSDSLRELKSDVTNTVTFVYLAMFGMAAATNNFTTYFRFTENEWSDAYADVDLNLSEKLKRLSIEDICKWGKQNLEEFKLSIFTLSNKRAYASNAAKELGIDTPEKFVTGYEELADSSEMPPTIRFFTENTFYISVKTLQQLVGNFMSASAFTQAFKKLYGISAFAFNYRNRPYVKAAFINNTITFFGD